MGHLLTSNYPGEKRLARTEEEEEEEEGRDMESRTCRYRSPNIKKMSGTAGQSDEGKARRIVAG